MVRRLQDETPIVSEVEDVKSPINKKLETVSDHSTKKLRQPAHKNVEPEVTKQQFEDLKKRMEEINRHQKNQLENLSAR